MGEDCDQLFFDFDWERVMDGKELDVSPVMLAEEIFCGR